MPDRRRGKPASQVIEPVAGENGATSEISWARVPTQFRTSRNALPPPWEAIFGPLRQGLIDDLVVVGQCGQSIDGRIATLTGHSHYINGDAGLAHLHRLRALVDAVVIGVGTAIADDPQLTVRRVAGAYPARVVVDPNGRLPTAARVLAADGVRRLVIMTEHARPAPGRRYRNRAATTARRPDRPGDNPRKPGTARFSPDFDRGRSRYGLPIPRRRLSRPAPCRGRATDLGLRPAGLALAPIERVDEAMRPPIRSHVLGEEVLLDCDLSAQRVPIGRAKMST